MSDKGRAAAQARAKKAAQKRVNHAAARGGGRAPTARKTQEHAKVLRRTSSGKPASDREIAAKKGYRNITFGEPKDESARSGTSGGGSTRSQREDAYVAFHEAQEGGWVGRDRLGFSFLSSLLSRLHSPPACALNHSSLYPARPPTQLGRRRRRHVARGVDPRRGRRRLHGVPHWV